MKTVQIMEPMLIRADHDSYQVLSEKAYDLALQSAALGGDLPAGLILAVGDMVRVVDCYYSNLIEGRSMMPVDIDQALRQHFHNDPARLELQEEALAHIKVQRWIDHGGMEELGFGVDGIKEVHRRFYEAMPKRLHWVHTPGTSEMHQVIPGEFRNHGVVVGNHVPCRPNEIIPLMDCWERFYSGLGKLAMVSALAAAHHRLVWIHPFTDGNGRVARLVTHAMMRYCMLGTDMWSASRGFGQSQTDYRRLLAACDQPQSNDLDGHGQLNERSLVSFTQYFLETSCDQVQRMSEALQVDSIVHQLMRWVHDREKTYALPIEKLLRYVLVHGEVPRGKAQEVTGLPERSCRRVVKALLEKHELMAAKSSRAPLKMHIPLRLAQDLFPRLIPENILSL
ncbi:Fic family protein [Saccharospirillum sp. HFRX-1]|uniref:Fic family protein n=1 Tax=unclassified Saccharospirillum TaxID=2633430 RepID=UPI00371C6991